MCLILFAKKEDPTYKFILAANRDEFFNRPTLEAAYWEDNRSILGGRDKQSMGTWLGVNTNGKFIAITNYRDPKNDKNSSLSRGQLSKQFLNNEINVISFIREISDDKSRYNGYNLLISEDSFENIYHYSNVSNQFNKIDNGFHGLSNHLLDTPWPKVVQAKAELENKVKSKDLGLHGLIEMLKNDSEAPESSLPNTGISLELEKKLSPVFISMKEYGTRCSTAILVSNKNELTFLEVSYNEKMQVINEKQFEVQLKS